MTLVETINKRYTPLFVAAKEYVPAIYTGLTDGIQTFPADGNAYAINAPIAGWIRDASRINEPDLTDDGAFILRTVLGYAAMVRIAENKAVGALTISNLINQLLTAIYLKYGTRVSLISFDTKDNPGIFLQELENHAGYTLSVRGRLLPDLYEDDI